MFGKIRKISVSTEIQKALVLQLIYSVVKYKDFSIISSNWLDGLQHIEIREMENKFQSFLKITLAIFPLLNYEFEL